MHDQQQATYLLRAAGEMAIHAERMAACCGGEAAGQAWQEAEDLYQEAMGLLDGEQMTLGLRRLMADVRGLLQG